MPKEFLKRLFPPPKFLRMPAIGMDVSAVSVRFVELLDGRHGLVLGKHAEHLIPPGVLSEEDIIDSDAFEEVLRKMRKDHHLNFVRVAIPESQAYLIEMQMPRVKMNELRESVEIQLEEHIPFKASEVYFDYVLLDQGESNHADDHLHIAVAAAPKLIVDKYVASFERAGLTVLSLEVDAEAMARAVVPWNDQGTLMIVEVGRVKTGVYIMSGGNLQFTSDIEIGGRALSLALEKKLGIDAGKAAEILDKCSGEETVLPPEVSAAVARVLTDLEDEVNRHYVFWHTHKDKDGNARPKIEKVILTGSQAFVCGLRGSLGRNLRVPVEMGNVWQNVSHFSRYIPEISFENSLRYATAVGLALYSKEEENN